MYEFYSRSYDPVNATWNRQDEYRGRLNDPQSVLRYLYVKQSPVNLKDYYGFDFFSDVRAQFDSIANTGVGIWIGQQIGQLDWLADTAIGITELVAAGVPLTYPLRLYGYATGQGDLVYNFFRDLRCAKSDFLSRAAGVGDEEYYRDGTSIFDSMFPGLTNLGNISNSNYSYLERGYLLGRAEGDVFDIATIAYGIYKGGAKVVSMIKSGSVEEFFGSISKGITKLLNARGCT